MMAAWWGLLAMMAIPIMGQGQAIKPPVAPIREYIRLGSRVLATEPPCQYTLTLLSNFGWNGGGKPTTLTTTPGCSWTVSMHASWINPYSTSPMAGTGSGTIQVFANNHPESTLPRTGAVTIGDQLLRFVQHARFPDPTYTFGDVGDDGEGDFGLFNYVALMKYYLVTAGCGDGTNYCPGDQLPKEQMAAFIVRAYLYTNQWMKTGYPYDQVTNPYGFQLASGNPYYTDVVSGTFFPYVQKLKELDLSIECGTNQFCPQSLVTREEMAEWVIRAMVKKNKFPQNFVYRAVPYFTDVPATHARFRYVQKLREQGVTAGITETSYGPSYTLLRSQMSVFLIRALFTM